MKLFRIYRDPDNPCSRFVWGIEPPSPKRRVRAWMRVLFDPAVLLMTWMVIRVHVNDVYQYNPPEGWLADGLPGGCFVLGLLVIKNIVTAREPQALRSHLWRDLRMAGLTGEQVLRGLPGPRLASMVLASALHVAGTLTALALLVQREILGLPAENYPDGRKIGFIVGMTVFFGSGVAGSAFYLIAAEILDAALWISAPGRIRRSLAVLLLAFSSPLLAMTIISMTGWSWGATAPTFFGAPAALEALSWPLRGLVVRRIRKRAARVFDTGDVP